MPSAHACTIEITVHSAYPPGHEELYPLAVDSDACPVEVAAGWFDQVNVDPDQDSVIRCA